MQSGGGQRRPGRGGAEPKAPMARRDLDINRERLVFCVTSLVGHKITAKLRNNHIYEGVFHSCSLDGDMSITMKAARLLPTENSRSGEVINTLLVPGKDLLQVTAVDVPSPVMPDPEQARANSGRFATDAEIAAQKAAGAGDRELVPFYDGGALEEGEGLDEMQIERSGQWDQFDTNAQMFGVRTTFREELYTTKLDPNAIPLHKREEADRIAREIEQGQMASEVDDRGEDGEEAAFSAVTNSGHFRGRKDGPSAKASGRILPLAELPSSGSASVPLTREHLSQHDRDSLAGVPADGFAREHRAKRGMITAHSAHSPMRSPMISEMKRINALNLEPALPKLDDKTRNDWITFKQNQSRTAAKSVQGNGLKSEFQKDLDDIKKREQLAAAKKGEQAQEERSAVDGAVSGGRGREPEEERGRAKEARPDLHRAATDTAVARRQEGTSATNNDGEMQGRRGGKGDGQMLQRSKTDLGSASGASPSSFKFNPGAKEFSFNPSAATFTPSNAGAQGGAAPSSPVANSSGGMTPQAKAPAGPPPAFNIIPGSDFLRMHLADIIDMYYETAKGDPPERSSPDWPEASNSSMSFKEVLGQPSQSAPMPPAGAMAGPGTMPGPWQQAPNQMGPPGTPQGQIQQGPGGPQMVPQGFMVASGPGPQQPQMYPQMYSGPGGGGVPVQRGPQNSGNMPPQQPMVFGQQGMVQQGQPSGQSMGMPAGMVPAQGQNPAAMGSVPKFGGQMVPTMVMAPGGQYNPQGFVPQQAVQGQGQAGQPGPQGQMMQQQGQMGMQQGWGQPDGRRQMGGGPPHPMGGMEG